MIVNCIAVGIGGFLGAITRFTLSKKVQDITGSLFPLGTLFVNITGCIIIGFMYALITKTNFFSITFQHFIDTGFLGGLTTFSSFGYETFALIQMKQYVKALINVLLQIFLGLGGVWLGYFLAFSLNIVR